MKEQQRKSKEEDAEAAIAKHEEDRSPAAGELHAGAALCCLAGSMLVLCAVFARRLWRCGAGRGEWREARAAPRVARMAPESALDEPAGAARAPCKLAHRLHAAVNSLVDGCLLYTSPSPRDPE